MPSLTCYRLRSRIANRPVGDFHEVIDGGALRYVEYGPIHARNFTAHVLVVGSVPHEPPWARFVRVGFDDIDISPANSPGALLIVEVPYEGSVLRFAFAFGVTGRFLLAADGFERGFGLRTALNVIYPAGTAAADAARLRSVDSKRRGPTIMRSRAQASEASAFEDFDVNQLQDVVSAAVGVPADTDTWGTRASGSDAFRIDPNIRFEDLGDLCLGIHDASERTDYADSFGWIDDIQPVTDPELRNSLEDTILRMLVEEDGGDLVLAPPEIVDWDRVSKFRYHFDRRQGVAHSPVTHSEMRLADYLAGIRHHHLDHPLTVDNLKSRRIKAVDNDAATIHAWSVWRCLVGELQLNNETYILDEGDLYHVRDTYLNDLDTYINNIPQAAIPLPPATPTTLEGPFNQMAAAAHGYVLLDQRTIRLPGRTTPVEVCDLLTANRDLVHVKRHFSSSNLSHLFAQGYVSAELLQMNTEFRQRAHARVAEFAGGRTGFDFFDTTSFAPRDFRIVYAIMARWAGRTPADALPFFAKINLRNFTQQLRARGFTFALNSIDTTPRTIASAPQHRS